MAKITIGNVCFLFNRKRDKILMLKRDFEPMKDLYTGVGGKTRFDEDIRTSCIREIREETGFHVNSLELKGIVKTLLDGGDSSWILFIYISDDYTGEQADCPEGMLEWVGIDQIESKNMIGFIREVMPFILEDRTFVEGTIRHDNMGIVLDRQLFRAN